MIDIGIHFYSFVMKGIEMDNQNMFVCKYRRWKNTILFYRPTIYFLSFKMLFKYETHLFTVILTSISVSLC